MEYIVTSLIITDCTDKFNEGEVGTPYVFEASVDISGKTIAELINKIGNEFLCSSNMDSEWFDTAVVFDDSVSLSGMVDENGCNMITESEWKSWEAGDIDLLAREIRFDIAVKLSHDELINAGIKNYD